MSGFDGVPVPTQQNWGIISSQAPSLMQVELVLMRFCKKICMHLYSYILLTLVKLYLYQMSNGQQTKAVSSVPYSTPSQRYDWKSHYRCHLLLYSLRVWFVLLVKKLETPLKFPNRNLGWTQVKLNLCHVISISISQKRKKKSHKNMLCMCGLLLSSSELQSNMFSLFFFICSGWEKYGNKFSRTKKEIYGTDLIESLPCCWGSTFLCPVRNIEMVLIPYWTQWIWLLHRFFCSS